MNDLNFAAAESLRTICVQESSITLHKHGLLAQASCGVAPRNAERSFVVENQKVIVTTSAAI